MGVINQLLTHDAFTLVVLPIFLPPTLKAYIERGILNMANLFNRIVPRILKGLPYKVFGTKLREHFIERACYDVEI